MRVLHIINSLGFGGAENLLKDALPVMCAKGIDVGVLVLKHQKSDFADSLVDSGIKVSATGVDGLYSPMQVAAIRSHIRKGNYDLIHVHLFPSLYWFSFARRLWPMLPPAVMTEHSTFNRRRRYPVLRPLEQYIYRTYDCIICISESTERNLRAWLPGLQGRTKTINNGVDLDRFNAALPLPRSDVFPGGTGKSILILMVARMTVQKDHETLIDALRYLPPSYRVVLVGDGPLRPGLEDICQEIGVRDRVQFLGTRNDVPRIMKAADLFVLSSHWEGFGLVAVEAMASGLPVMASDVEGLASVVGSAGRLFQPGDAKELAGFIRRVSEHPDAYQSMVRKGYGQATRFSIGKMVDQYIAVYKEILRGC